VSSAAASEIVMFDDGVADEWAPFALTRPCGELRFGRWRLRERIERISGLSVAGHLTRPWLGRFAEPGAAPVVELPDLGPVPRIYWCSRAVLDLAASLSARAANLWLDGRLAGAALAADADPPDRSWLAAPTPLPGLDDVELDGEWLEHAWDLVVHGASRLGADLGVSLPDAGADLPAGVWRLGTAPLVVGPGAEIEPGVLLDTRRGPIELGPDVSVQGGARLAGPLFAGHRSRLLGGSMSAVSAGPYSFLRGEIEEATVIGCANKAHDGFLGHAYLGSWVNLGAMTTNSDLKNNYGAIRVGPPGAEVDTGVIKLGCLIGDHAKTGIGTLLTSGTIVGAGSALFGSDMPPRWIPPFSWGTGADLATHRRDDFRGTAETVMTRRGLAVGDDTRAYLEAIWEAGAG